MAEKNYRVLSTFHSKRLNRKIMADAAFRPANSAETERLRQIGAIGDETVRKASSKAAAKSETEKPDQMGADDQQGADTGEAGAE